MGKSLAFLDFFACSEIREAFVHGKAAFVLQKNSGKLLWINAKAAKFFGFADVFFAPDLDVVAEFNDDFNLVEDNAFFNKALCQEIVVQLQDSGKIALKGKTIRKTFSLQMVTIPHLDEKVILAVAVQKNKSPAKKTLLDGLETENNAAALLDDAGTILHATTNFKPFTNLDSIIALAVDDLPRKAIINGHGHLEGQNYTAYIIKLSSLNCYLLHIELIEHAITPKGLQNIIEEGGGRFYIKQDILIQNENGLSEIERSAFKEIAARLRFDLQDDAMQDKQLENEEKQPNKNHKNHNNDDKGENFADILSLIASPLPDFEDDKKPKEQKQQLAEKQPEQIYQLKPASIYNLLDTVTDGVIWLDHCFRIRHFSFAATALTSYEGHMLAGSSLSHVFTKASFNKINNYLQGFTKTGMNLIFSSGEYGDLIAGNGALISVFVTIVPLAKGEGYAALLKDMTNVVVKKTATKDKQSEQQYGALAETMHEIRTPLSAMLGFAEIMQQEFFGTIENPRYQRYLQDIVQSGKHILSLVNRHLEQAKIQHVGALQPEKTTTLPIDVVTIIRESVSLLEQQVQDNGIIMRIILPDALPAIKVDEQEFRQIIWNILANSIRFTQNNGKIVVYAALIAEEYVKISVSDNGIGMSEEEMAKAILPYGQISRKDGRKGNAAFNGTGLGLPTTKKLVEKNGGQFMLLSVPNQGTTVEMSFPLFKTAKI